MVGKIRTLGLKQFAAATVAVEAFSAAVKPER
jgi:hypothetical protein